MSRASAARPGALGKTPAKLGNGYFLKSERPWTSLVFLLPFLVIYEVGTRYLLTDPVFQIEHRIIAFTKMQEFFRWCGASGRYLPALAVVGMLLGSHIARRDPWDVTPRHLFGMLAESAVLAVPLIVLGLAIARYVPLYAVPGELPGAIILSIGAGIYEELVFRLLAFSLLSILLIDGLQIPKRPASPLIVVMTAVGFSLYHYWGSEAFHLRTFAFRTAAGLYFGLVFAFRGFGITAGSHAAYDIIISVMRDII